MVLSEEHPRVIRYRSAHPVLTPDLPQERRGIVANVVFPTGIDRRDDLGSPHRFDIYYGMADDRIGVACMEVPDSFPPGDSPTRPKKRSIATLRETSMRSRTVPVNRGSRKDLSLY